MVIDKLSYDNIETFNYENIWDMAKEPDFEIDKNNIKNILHEYYDIDYRLKDLNLYGKCDFINITSLMACLHKAVNTCNLTSKQVSRLELWMQGMSGTEIAESLGISNKVFYASLDVSCIKIAERLKEVILECV